MKRKTRTGIICASLLLAGLVCLGFWRFFSDEGPPADADLLPVRRAVAAAENGFPLLDLGMGATIWPQPFGRGKASQVLEGEFEPAWVEGVLKDNAAALRSFEDSLRLPEFQVAEIRDIEDSQLYLLAWNDLAALIELRARLHLERGEEAEAIEQWMRLLEFGHRVQGAQGGLMTFLSGTNRKHQAASALRRMLARKSLSETELRPLIDRLGKHLAVARSIEDVLKLEYALHSRVLDDIAAGKRTYPVRWAPSWTSRGLLKPNQTRRWFAEAFRQLLADAARSHKERRPQDHAGRAEGRSRTWMPSGNALGREIYLSTLPTLEFGILDARDRTDLEISATRLLIALRCFHIRHGRLPASLAELVPEYLDKVLADPYDGEPLRYSAERRIVYSVGKDLRDAGGSMKDTRDEAERDRDEPTFRIEFSNK